MDHSPSRSIDLEDGLLENTLDEIYIDHVFREDPKLLTVRRGHCLNDLRKIFLDESFMKAEIRIRMRLPNGDLEVGEGYGVYRDCLSEFWTEFYETCTLGTDVKVPFIRHDYQEDEWKAIGRVLMKGWKDTGYFPIHLAKPFMEEVLYSNRESALIEAWASYAPMSISPCKKHLMILNQWTRQNS